MRPAGAGFMFRGSMRSFVYIVLLGLCLLTLALVVESGIFAIKNPGAPINSAMRYAMEHNGVNELSEQDARIIRERYASAHHLRSGLRYELVKAGHGPVPRRGQYLTVSYTGRLLDGTVFDSTEQHGHPFTFQLGSRRVIPGWEQAFSEMRVGEERVLIIPFWLAYGEAGKPPVIPPGATLVFDVHLLSIH